MCGTDCFLMLLSVLFPPIGVWVKRGICSADSLINIALCCLAFLPGLLHAWYIILQNPDPYDSYDGYGPVPDQEGGRQGTTYYVVSHTGPARQQGGMNYGTVPQQQQTGVTNQNAPKKATKGGKAANGASRPGDAPQHLGGEGSSREPEGPPSYADVIKGDHKVQSP
ncbi:UPF0057-domain-containing protein [Didymella exigua CBS 183.55]|uniref:UPF0057-domain-containing protein n=1 Tax=Didymella exigua CBS 183.55 TaxID=1150837 RepID=A0A6A5RKX9_9PLEO|nr:UPF0057-domain-containing protein [Didymella exigua CBS 183.55]KAF1927910.1 UPF0057-domain-containing protein [Didymella exigua CBS 183.55]